MSFRDCIVTARDDQKVSAAKAAAALQAYDDAVANGIAAGLSDGAAHNAASKAAVAQLTEATARKRWAKIHELRKAKALHDSFAASKNPSQTLSDLADRQETITRRFKQDTMRHMAMVVDKFRARALGSPKVDDLNDLVAALSGERASPEGVQMAEAIKAARKFQRDRLNMEGASIPENEGNWAPQQLDKLMVRRAGRTLDESRAIFTRDMMDSLDWDNMEFEGAKIPAQKRQEILERSFNSIATDGADRIVPGHTQHSGFLTRLERQRFFVYKDSASYLRMQEKYGSGNIIDQIIGEMDAHSIDLAQLQTLGPNPVAGNHYLTNLAKKRASELDLAKGSIKGESLESKTDRALELYNNRFRILTHNVLNGSENALVTSLNTVRQGVNTAMTMGSALYTPADIASALATKHNYHLPADNLVKWFFQSMLEGKQSRIHAIENGTMLEDVMARNYTNMRYFGMIEGAKWMQGFSDRLHRFTLSNLMNQSIKEAWAKGMQAGFARESGKAWEKLEWRDLAEQLGITKGDWEAFRQLPHHTDGGVKFLRPADAWNAGNHVVADKFSDFVDMTSRIAVPTPSTRVAALFGKHISPATMAGQMQRMLTAMQSFNATFFMMQMKYALRMGDPATRAWRLARLVAYMSLGGVLITQTKALKNGEDFHDMSTLDFGLKSFSNGGAFGALGDIIASIIGSKNYNAAGPVIDFASELQKLTIGNAVKAAQGKDTHVAADSVMFASQYSPKPWQIQLLFDRMVRDQLLEMSDPSVYNKLRRKQRQRERDTGVTHWWGMGESPEAPGYGTR